MKVTSEAFSPNEPIPERYTAEGENTSPPLAWNDAPEGTREFALICEDPDAPQPDPFVHWLVYSIPASRSSLPEGTAGGAFEGTNGFGQTGYGGPAPPSGDGPHHYHFRMYAVDEALSLSIGATKQELLDAMESHILDQAELVGTFER